MSSHVGPMLQGNGVSADTFEELAEKAIATLDGKMGLCIVCGPITTGGTGNQTYNFQIFNAVIRGLERSGKQLFNQVPYEFGLRKLAHAWEAAGNTGYCLPILTEFYAKLFESGAICEGYFIPGWESSFGARWEREKLTHLCYTIHDLTLAEIQTFLLAEYPEEHVKKIMTLVSLD